MKHTKYIDTSTSGYKEFEKYILDNHPDPDHLVNSMERWYWMYQHMKKEGEKAAADSYIQGFFAAKEALNTAFDNVRKKVKQRFGI